MPNHIQVNPKRSRRIQGPQIRLKQALVGVSIEPQVPLLDERNAAFQVLAGAEEPDEDVDGGDGAAKGAAVHVAEELARLVESSRVGGLGEDEEVAVVGEGLVAEIRV